MNYPQLSLFGGKGIDQEEAEGTFELIVDCMESVYDAEEVHKMKDTPRKETMNFLMGLTQKQFEKIQNFFLTMPKLQYKTNITCPKCKEKNDIVVEGLQNFFG